ncbi:glycosyltransferase family 39 protein [Actinokineospora auranticolor]|uniref:4-amino-4-deoxy-L-arabinose transferase-like glycosyltransferase n=1 Tax=Actinokineospora auranticolor TaxID=155976 RepID=A0A2S6H0J0_9PSEU|nr:glycosyltransferase family 39 protein [Actinokineospora auranticolor]PPK70978.1 4-amino-4-deoxy-L-arabinose transferase-like glycosyltransferase [Actinokineospora auranticolor]
MTAVAAPERPAARASAAARRPGWELPSALVLLAATACLYLWDLSASGTANQFYAAAAQAGTQSWKALFFGSLDAGNVITVDKPPAALWLMALSGRVFGFSAWSLLLPQALAGVASVWLLYRTVRRWSGPVAGLLAGAGLALTPVAALMFRFDNPDALLVLLLVAGAYCVVRATERANPWWLALAGAAIGFGFLTKMLQAFLVLPAFALVYAVAAPTSPLRRALHLLGATVAVAVSAGWYVLVVDLWPADSRPYIGGSTDNTELDLALGYNGLGRILGGAGNGGGGGGPMGGGNTSFGGETGLFRMLGAAFGQEVSWLLPAALIGLVAGLWFTRRAARTDRTRAALLLWGGWTVVTGLVFSFMQGTVHPYYAIALAPGTAALVGVAAAGLWQGREHRPARVVLAAMVAVSAIWGFALLDRTGDWLPWLRWVVAVSGVLAATAVAVGAHRFRRAAAGVAVAALVASFGATAMFTVATASTPHAGSIPVSGPSGQGRGGIGGPGMGTVSDELVAALRETTGTWAAASTGSQGAAQLQLASGRPVIAIGGFNGGDPAPTLARFQAYVASGQVRYYIGGGGGGGGFGGRGGGGEIASWVRENFAQVTIGGQTVYDLGAPLG